MDGWTSSFPASIVDSISSTKFIKRLFTIALSTIAYVRNVLPDCSFDNRIISSLSLKIIRPNCDSSELLLTWLRGCFDAMEKGYLEQVSLGIFTDIDDINIMQEVYNFSFIYSENASQIVFNGFKSKQQREISNFTTIQTDTISLLVALKKVFDSLKRHDDAPYLTMKLTFTKDTPADYQPVGFINSIYKKYDFQTKPVSLMEKKVNTGFHVISLQVLADSNILTHNVKKLSFKENQLTASECNQEALQISQTSTEILKFNYVLIEVDPKEVKSNINCPCGIKSDNGPYMQCKLCNKYRHSACFGFIDQEKSILTESCHECSPNNTNYSLIEENEKLQSIGIKSMQLCCLWRRSLLFFVLNSSFHKSKFTNFTESREHSDFIISISEQNRLITRNDSQSGSPKYYVNTKVVMDNLRSNHINQRSQTSSILTKTDTVNCQMSSKSTQNSLNSARVILSPEIRMFDIVKRTEDRKRATCKIAAIPLSKAKRVKVVD